LEIDEALHIIYADPAIASCALLLYKVNTGFVEHKVSLQGVPEPRLCRGGRGLSSVSSSLLEKFPSQREV
jgi:hypothetical protein